MPDESVRFLLAAMVVAPLSEIAPVPVENVPAPEIAKLPDDWAYPVSPDIAPAAVRLTVGEVMKLLKPVPKVMPLKVLLVAGVTVPKLRPVIVLVFEPFAVPVRLTSIPSTVLGLVFSVSVALIVVAVPELLL